MDNIPRFERRPTLMARPGMEGRYVSPNCFSGKSIAVFTSGGDAQGMNSAVRAVVRMGIYAGAKVYFIHEGYQGMVDGGDNIQEASWASVSGIMNMGGTVIGSARCTDFREEAGRLKACYNLVSREITNLVVIGGDGSLTGANLFRIEWPQLLEKLTASGQITADIAKKYNRLNIVGLVGSIDNDFCGTDMTIGADSALHRIIEACDAIVTTAHSHQRCFVLEVMGRHCGYLALVAGLASEADFVFIPELPPEADWKKDLCDKLETNRKLGQRVNIIIVAEGAIDRDTNPISSKSIRDLIAKEVGLDTRITVLGHVQRGGSPSAFDRILGCRMGAEAVLALIDADGDESIPACVISLSGNQPVRSPMLKCVENTRAIADAMKNKKFSDAVTLRGRSFINNLEMFLLLSKIEPPEATSSRRGSIGIVNLGAPACGMNAAMRSFARISLTNGFKVIGIQEGMKGLSLGQSQEIRWNDVRGWVSMGGSALGSRRDLPSDVGIDRVADEIAKLNLRGLFILGGFEALTCAKELGEARSRFKSLCIPIVVLPATISNNVPCSDFSLGADTAINEITQMIDKIKQSAVGTKRRVFVVETMGAKCGYLATMSGLAGGADAAYIYEEKFTIDDLRMDVKHIRAKIEDNVKRGLIVVADQSSKNYTSEFISNLYSEEGRGAFDCRHNVLGHSQQGGFPSPFDRNLGTKMGAKAAKWILNQVEKYLNDGFVYTTEEESICLLGMLKRQSTFTPLIDVIQEADFKNRVPINQWWMALRPLLRIMAKHESLYACESIMHGAETE